LNADSPDVAVDTSALRVVAARYPGPFSLDVLGFRGNRRPARGAGPHCENGAWQASSESVWSTSPNAVTSRLPLALRRLSSSIKILDRFIGIRDSCERPPGWPMISRRAYRRGVAMKKSAGFVGLGVALGAAAGAAFGNVAGGRCIRIDCWGRHQCSKRESHSARNRKCIRADELRGWAVSADRQHFRTDVCGHIFPGAVRSNAKPLCQRQAEAVVE